MSLEVINSPIFATIQDNGRFSYSNIGVTSSGVMDEYAFNILNLLLENKDNCNCIEIAFSNVSFKINKNTKIALTGAYCEFFINDIKKDIWQTHTVKVGDIIKVGRILDGSKVYFGVKGGFLIKKQFSSVSTCIKEGLGGLNGNKLMKNDILNFNEFKENFNRRLKKEYLPKYEEILELRVLLSYQHESFSKEEKEKFFSSSYEVGNDFNRMACKLKGEPIKSSLDGIISEGIALGSIQIPSDGQPIILLKERQTIGGYPKIGTVLDIDCFKLAQAKPKTKIIFKEISLEESQKISKRFYKSFM